MKNAIKLIVILLLFITPRPAFAQTSGLNPTQGYEISDKDAVDGDILVYTNSGLARTNVPYSKDIFGVLNKQALITIDTGNANEIPVTTSGTAAVNVTTINGQIKKGDLITTSTVSGKGQKADASGYVLGRALADFNEPKDNVGQIPIAVKIEYISTNTADSTSQLFGSIGSSLFQNIKDPKNFGQVLRFIIAGVIAISGFLVGFITFSRSIPRSIEAIGRNPMAKQSVYVVLAMNILLSIAVILIGVAASFLILKI